VTRPPGAWRAAVLAAALAVAAYANTLRGELVYDDVADIVRNRLVRDFEVARIFGEPSWATWVGIGYAGYRPLTTLTFALNHAAHGLEPVGYHAVNVALHAAASALLAILVARLLGSVAAAALVGALFATHPVHSEAVASVVGRADVLATLLALLCWWLLLGRERGRDVPLPRRLLAAAVLALAILAKESAVAILGVVILADVIDGTRHGEAPGVTLRARRVTHVLLAVAAAGVLLWRSAVLQGSGGGVTVFDNVLVGEPYAGRIATTLALATRYVEKLVWPLRLSADSGYGEIDIVPWSDPRVLAGVLLLGLLATAGGRLRSAGARVGLVLLVVPLAVVVLIAFLALGPPLAERLLYLPSAGFCVLLALAIEGVAARGGSARLLAYGGAAAIVVAYGGLAAARNRVWREPGVFFRTMVADAPNSARAHRELGTFLGERNEFAPAVAELEASLAILPHPATAYSLGIVLGRARRPDEAIAAYQRALSLRPDFAEAMTNLATTYGDAGDDATAVTWFERALAIRPGLVELHMNYANSLQRLGRLREAAEHYEKAVALEPRDPAVRFNYGVCLERLGRPADAARQYEAAIAARPDWPLPHQRLVNALLAAGREDEAAAAQEEAKRILAPKPTPSAPPAAP
jgi:Tfp pilus assembly protein PilF